MDRKTAVLCLLLAACSDRSTSSGDAAVDVRRSEAAVREAGVPEAAQHDLPADMATRDLARLDAAKLDLAKPDAAKLDLAKPDVAKPDGGACVPYCGAVGSYSEGWYDGCTKQLMQSPQGKPWFDQCAKCTGECRTGSAGVGWYKLCETLLLTGTAWGSSTACKPYCGAIGSKSEGCDDGCTNQLMKDPISGTMLWAQCANCVAACKHIGSCSEGWYSECSGDLIAASTCTP